MSQLLTCVRAVSLLHVEELPQPRRLVHPRHEVAHGLEPLRALVDHGAHGAAATVGIALRQLVLVFPTEKFFRLNKLRTIIIEFLPLDFFA